MNKTTNKTLGWCQLLGSLISFEWNEIEISSLETISKNKNKRACHLVNLTFFHSFLAFYFAAPLVASTGKGENIQALVLFSKLLTSRPEARRQKQFSFTLPHSKNNFSNTLFGYLKSTHWMLLS